MGVRRVRQSAPVVVALVAAGALAVAVPLGASAQHRGEKLTFVNVDDTNGIPFIYLQLGVYEGFFRRNGLAVNAQAVAGPVVSVPALLNGSIQFTGAPIASVLQAVSNGLPIRMVAPGTYDDPSTPDFQAIVVTKDSPIQTPADLTGKTIAANTLRSVPELCSKAGLAKLGVDVSTLKFLPLDFPLQQAALEAGQIDAAYLIEPFLYEAQQAGDRVIAYPCYLTKPGMQISSYVTSASFSEQHAGVVQAFQRSLQQLSLWVQQHPGAVRKFITASGGPPAAVAQHMTLPVWKTSISIPSIQLTSSLMVEYGILPGPVDPKTFVIQTPPLKR